MNSHASYIYLSAVIGMFVGLIWSAALKSLFIQDVIAAAIGRGLLDYRARRDRSIFEVLSLERKRLLQLQREASPARAGRYRIASA
jgi:hypothetical protein